MFLVIKINFFFLVECAHLRGGSGFSLKPNPYVEFSIDSSNPKKTEVVKCTYQPKWNEEFTVYVLICLGLPKPCLELYFICILFLFFLLNYLLKLHVACICGVIYS